MPPSKASLLPLILLISLVSLVSFSAPGSPVRAPSFSPEAVSAERTRLYLEAGKKPLSELAAEIYQLATDSERCRTISGAGPCGLASQPLKSGSLTDVFSYYVSGPIEASLSRQKVEVRKSDWAWKAGGAAGAQHPARK